MKLKIFGRVWTLQFVPSLPDGQRGTCDAPTARNKIMAIRRSLKGELKLDTLIHEQLHAADWYRDEEWTGQVATDIARNLWKLGYRNIEEINDASRRMP
jgi:hypothetical protein